MQDLQLELTEIYRNLEQVDVMPDTRITASEQSATACTSTLLRNVLGTIARWIDSPRKCSEIDEVHSLILDRWTFTDRAQASVWLLERLVGFLDYMIKASQLHCDGDPSHRVHLHFGFKLLTFPTGQASSVKPLLQAVRKCFGDTLAPMRLGSGLSMERMWIALRPQTVGTFEQLQILWRLEDIAQRFDQRVHLFRAPISQKVALRKSIARAGLLAFDHDVAFCPLIQVSETATPSQRMQLTERSDRTLNK